MVTDAEVRLLIQFYDRAGNMLTNRPDDFSMPSANVVDEYLALLDRKRITYSLFYRSDKPNAKH